MNVYMFAETIMYGVELLEEIGISVHRIRINHVSLMRKFLTNSLCKSKKEIRDLEKYLLTWTIAQKDLKKRLMQDFLLSEKEADKI